MPNLKALKGSSFIDPHVIPNLYDFFFLLNIKEDVLKNVQTVHRLPLYGQKHFSKYFFIFHRRKKVWVNYLKFMLVYVKVLDRTSSE